MSYAKTFNKYIIKRIDVSYSFHISSQINVTKSTFG